MSNNILPITNIIDVSIVPVGASGIPLNPNNIVLFTTDTASNSEVFGNYINSSQVGVNYGTSSATYKMAVNIFSQDLNPLSAGGQLIIVPLLTSETLVEAIARTSNLISYTGMLDTLGELADDVVSATAAVCQSNFILWVHPIINFADIAGIATTVSAASQTYTRLVYYNSDILTAQLYAAAYAGRLFSTDFTGSNTASTMNLKSLTNVVPDGSITQTIYEAANIAGCDLYVSYQGVPGVYTTTGNSHVNDIYNSLALRLYLLMAGFNYLKATSTKVPQTQDGFNGLLNAYTTVYLQFVANGTIGVGLQWGSPDTFGDPVALRRNITQQGFYQYAPPIANMTQAQRIAKKSPLIQAAVQFSGDIDSSTIISFIEY